jgi:hypothetical protein
LPFYPIVLKSILFRSLLCFFLFSGILQKGKAATLQNADSSRAVRVFLNCAGSWCWQDYLKSQTTWAYFVQDQFVADVNLRVNSLENGSGGSEYKLIFEGLGKISHLRDTVTFSANGIQTDNEVRDLLLRHVQLGLVRYAMQTESHDVLKISSTDSSDRNEIGQGSNPEEDPYNAWVYNLSVWGNGDGQKSNNNLSLGAWAAAGQIKETHKMRIAGSYNTRINKYDYEGTQKTYQVDRYRAVFFYVKSLNPHWSLGSFHIWGSSTFDNLKHFLTNAIALEYNLFPYKESQTRQLTASLHAGSLYNRYMGTTIYLKNKELRPQGRFNIQGTFNPSWGSATLGLMNTILLDDVQKFSSSVNASISARIFKGLSISLDGNFSLIRNQINLPADGASIDEVLLSQQVIATSYSYYFYASLNYRFGSIFNNVVNTRFQDEF